MIVFVCTFEQGKKKSTLFAAKWCNNTRVDPQATLASHNKRGQVRKNLMSSVLMLQLCVSVGVNETTRVSVICIKLINF